MRVLMLGRWLPLPARASEGGREHHIARDLARTHQVTLAFTTDEPDPTGAVAATRAEFDAPEFAVVPRTWKCLASAVRLATGASFSVGYFRSEALSRRLRERARSEPWDLVYVSSSCMISYALELGGAIPIVVDYGELDSEWWAHQAAARSFPSSRFFATEAARLRRSEGDAARRAALCIVASAAAARAVAALAPSARVRVIADGVDAQHFGPLVRVGGQVVALILGAVREPADVDRTEAFSRSVVTATRREHPDARFIALGRHSALAAKRLAAIPGLALPDTPDRIRSLLHDAVLGVAAPAADAEQPATVLAAMATGLPVVTAPSAIFGAAPGLVTVDGDDPMATSARIVELLRQPALRAQIGARGRAFVVARHSWSSMSDRVRAAVDAEASRSVPPAPRNMLAR